jgi:8-oxo-dGTP pyrophosphatase MutT (NUDIX family)
MSTPSPADKSRRQVAALPVRLSKGIAEVMLITSRDTGRWIVPKGWLKKGRPPHVTAAREAFEEAGLVGRAFKRPVGTYRYDKRLSASETVPCEVRVFLIEVERQLDDWPERTQRRRRWFAAEAAAVVVGEVGLAVLLRQLTAVAPTLTGVRSLLGAKAGGG